MRILFVVHNQTRKGGAYFRARGLAKPLIRLGHEVTILTISQTARWQMTEAPMEDFRVAESPDLLWGRGRSGWDPWDTLRRTWWILRRRFDVIHTIDTRPAVVIPALIAHWFRRGKWIADWTDWWGRGGATTERSGGLANKIIGPLEQFFEEKPRPFADGTVVISRALGARAEGLGIPSSQQLYLPPGADPQDIRDTPIMQARDRFQLNREGRYLGYLGNIYPRDAELIWETLRRVQRRDAHLLMVGDPGVQPPADLAGRVTITGRVPFGEMLDRLSACDVLVLPLTDSVANRGRWPSKINEYVAVGRATVACGVGDVADLLKQNDIGLVCRPDPAEFAACIDELFADLKRTRAMGDRARELARGAYSQDAVGGRLEAFYRKIIAGQAPASGA